MAEKARKVKRLEREPGYLYFLDKEGGIPRTPIANRDERKTGEKSKTNKRKQLRR
jgi:hypothetical protein